MLANVAFLFIAMITWTSTMYGMLANIYGERGDLYVVIMK